MTKLTIHADRSNALKKLVLNSLNIAICDIYRLTSVSGKKIKAMTSYVIDLRAGE